jgi:23S rRNA-/tRNA-specific pseudouridylate synthase
LEEFKVSRTPHLNPLSQGEVKNVNNLIISVLEVQIKTGRMHQIRVHLASIGNPIL